MKDLILKPRISEKAYAKSQAEGIKTYVFIVPNDANKHTVARAVASQFEVQVTGVRILNVKGKPKMSYRKGLRPLSGNRSNVKKAYVTLADGAELPLFVEENQTDEKADKKANAELKAAKVLSKLVGSKKETK